MVDFTSARKAMVDNQIQTSAVNDRRLLQAMGRVPRERFVPAVRQSLAYIDDSHPLGDGRDLPAPAVFARLAQLAAVTESDRVLVVNSGLGYALAVLSNLCREAVGLDADAAMAAQANEALAASGIGNASVTAGTPDQLNPASFDVIFVEGEVDMVPEVLPSLLAPGGRLVALVRSGLVGSAMLYMAKPVGITVSTHFEIALPPRFNRPVAVEFVF